jgi:hypothetical protein
MKVLLGVILSAIMLNCVPNLNMDNSDIDNESTIENKEKKDEYFIDDFGDRLQLDEEEEIISYLRSINNPQKVFNELYCKQRRK